MRQVSAKRRKRDAVYGLRRVEVFERGGGVCEFCLSADMTDVHHIEGRLGADPHRLGNLVGLCVSCHRRVHENPVWARSVGLSRSRLAK